MKALVVGQNSKIANVLSFFCDEVYMAVDKKISNYRSYKENDKFHLLDTSLNIRSPKAIIPRAYEIRRWVKQYDIDIVFTNEKYSMIAAKIAKITTFHKIVHLSTSHNSYAWLNREKVKKFVKLIDLTCDGFIAMASFVHDTVSEFGFPRHKLLMLPNALESGIFKMKNDYGLKEESCKLVYTAAIYPGKRQDFAVEIVHRLHQYGLNATIDFYGEIVGDDYYRSIIEKIRKYNLQQYITFCGRVENDFLRDCLCDYDMYLCPTKMEMSPFNILEAQEAGLPIVSTNVGGIPDMIKNGYNGIMLDMDDIEGFVRAVINLAKDSNLRKSLGENARHFVSEDNSPENAAKKISYFINNL